MKKLRNILPLFLIGGIAFVAHRMAAPPPVPADIANLVSHVGDYNTERVRASAMGEASLLLQQGSFKELARVSESLRRSQAHTRSGESLYSLWIEGAGNGLARLAQSDYPKAQSVFEGWRSESAGKPNAQLAWGAAMIEYAWQARGGGYARTVTDERFRLFGERLEIARKALGEVEAADPLNPALWSSMLTLDRGVQAGVPVQLGHSQRAREADPQDLAPACAMGGNLLPRWYGTKGDVEAYLNGLTAQCAPLDGDEVYCQVGLAVLTYGQGTQDETNLDWERIKRGYAKLQSGHRTWDRLDCSMLLGAALKRDEATMRRTYDGLSQGYDPQVLPEEGMATLAKSLGRPAVQPESLDPL